MPNIEQLSQYISEQNENRRLFVESDTPEAIAAMIQDEAQELAESINEAMVTDNVFEVASEIGDLGYLLLKLCNQLGIDLETAIEMKTIRNSYKYADHVMSNGRDMESASRVVKESWKAMGGDAAWSHVYLDYLASEE